MFKLTLTTHDTNDYRTGTNAPYSVDVYCEKFHATMQFLSLQVDIFSNKVIYSLTVMIEQFLESMLMDGYIHG